MFDRVEEHTNTTHQIIGNQRGTVNTKVVSDFDIMKTRISIRGYVRIEEMDRNVHIKMETMLSLSEMKTTKMWR